MMMPNVRDESHGYVTSAGGSSLGTSTQTARLTGYGPGWQSSLTSKPGISIGEDFNKQLGEVLRLATEGSGMT
jgi:hypothetical protein